MHLDHIHDVAYKSGSKNSVPWPTAIVIQNTDQDRTGMSVMFCIHDS